MHRRKSHAHLGSKTHALAALGLLCGLTAGHGQGDPLSLCNDFSVPGAHLGNVEGCDFDGSTSTINLSRSAVLHWDGGFNVLQNQNLRFQFNNTDGTTGTVLNRDLSGNGSVIAGGLTSNGRIALINPANSITITNSALIDADDGFLASTLDAADENALLNGENVTFHGSGGSFSRIVNQGTLRSSGGDVTLISGSVINSRLIEATNGAVRIGAGTTVQLLGSGDTRINVITDDGRNTITNAGTISARNAVELETGAFASPPAGTQPSVLTNDGIIRTTRADGRVYLSSLGGGRVVNSDDALIDTGAVIVNSVAPLDNRGDIVQLDDGSNPSAPSGSRQFPRLGSGQLSSAPVDDFRLSRLSFSHLNGLESKKPKKPTVKKARSTSAVAVRGSETKKKPAPKKVILRRGSFFGKKTS